MLALPVCFDANGDALYTTLASAAKNATANSLRWLAQDLGRALCMCLCTDACTFVPAWMHATKRVQHLKCGTS